MTRSHARARSLGSHPATAPLAVAFALLALHMLCAPAAPLHAQAPRPAASTGVVQCQKCHGNREFLVGKATTARGDSALLVPDSLLRDSRHATLSCADCHPGVGAGYPHTSTVVAVPCQKCHEKAGAAWTRSIHAPNARTVGDAPTCVTCHTRHHVLSADDPRSSTYALNVAKLCGSCHSDRHIVGTYFKNPKDAQARTAVAEYYRTVHGTAMSKAGLVVAATCHDCHDAHAVLPADSAASTINRAHVAQTCGSCHAGVLATFDSSSHGLALASGRKTDTGHQAPVCVDCHPGHQIVAADDSVWFRGVVKECGACHERLTKTYFETYHGQVTELGYGLTAKCSDCHTAHAMLPPTDARSSVNPNNLVATCGRCHANSNAKFVQYMPHGDPQNRAKNPGLFWVWLFMTTLLVSVFAFFGLHTVLWLFRLTIDRLHGGSAAEPPPTGDAATAQSNGAVHAPATPLGDARREPVGSGTREDR